MSKELIGIIAIALIFAYTILIMLISDKKRKKPRKLKDITFSDAIEELKRERKQGCSYRSNETCRFCETKCFELMDEGFKDEVGGYHEGGIGWNPQGEWCGECTSATCKGCPNQFKEPSSD